MCQIIVHATKVLTLLGAGKTYLPSISMALTIADKVVAADGGAALALARDRIPDAVIGDLDSLSTANRAAIPPDRLHFVENQETTDFDKCLERVAAPLILATGFSGGRLDHELAAVSSLARHPDKRCILLGEEDLCFLAPMTLRLTLPPGTRVSLFPLGAVTGTSRGLRWPINGLQFDPITRIGTSNEVTEGEVVLEFSARAMLIILPLGCLSEAANALAPDLGTIEIPAN